MIIEVTILPHDDIFTHPTRQNELCFRYAADQFELPRLPDPGPFTAIYELMRYQEERQRREKTIQLIAASIANALAKAMDRIDSR